MMIYKNSLEHLIAELRRIDLIVNLNLEKVRAERGTSCDEFQGLYISEEEVDTILKKSPYEFKSDDAWAQQLLKIETLGKEIDEKKAQSLIQGKKLRLHIFSKLFKLTPFEIDALLICIAPELDMRYEKLYSYIQDDVTKKRPTVDLVIKLLCSSMEEGFRVREIFSPFSPLLKNHLIYLSGEEAQIPLLSRSIKVDERIIFFLLGSDLIDPYIRNFSKLIYPERTFNDLILEDNKKNELMELVKKHPGNNIPLIFFFHGPYGAGKKMVAEAACNELRKPMLVIDSKALIKDESLFIFNMILREAQLQNSSVYFEGIDALWKEKEVTASIMKIFQALDSFQNLVFMSGEDRWEPSGIIHDHGFISMAFPVPSYELRKSLWTSFLNSNMSEDVDPGDLASKFKFSGGQIKDAIKTSNNIAMVNKPAGSKLSMDELYEGCKAQSNKNLIAFAKKIEPHYNWNDIILPDDIRKHLLEISGYIKCRGTVYSNWGFDKKLSLGKGLNVIFSGPSGTGKTMAAEIIAFDAKLDLYKIDLSSVVSKYIGETEKNLKNIFKEAETSNAILFFDEADALFGKRSEVKDSHDRYANIEINYLLQKMEEHVGLVILASNLSKNIDDAFMRRMQFVVDFPFPDDKQRLLIWKGIFPKEAPLSDDIDYKFISQKLKLAGGNIKNMALAAAFYAAQDGFEINMQHIMNAAKREYQKIGKPFLKEDFVPYHKLIDIG
jgi:SpoVK/Ycf46/Vps4 family AAA+-type ATPase